MQSVERREAILLYLQNQNKAVSGEALGKLFEVSRQVVVQDIALLRAQGFDIASTHRGYILASASEVTRLFKLRHSEDAIEQELNTIVDLGGSVLDVQVNHRTYGLISAALNISNRRDVKRFLNELKTGVSSPLCNVTDGYHFHTVSADSEEILDEIGKELAQLGFVAELTDFEKETFL